MTLGGIGIILGAGIYALVGAVAAEAGDGMWMSFALAAAVSATVGLCYAELASMLPRAGADYEYTLAAIGERSAFVVGWLMVVGIIIGAATVSLGFGGYLGQLTGVDPRLAALLALAAGTSVALYGIRETVWVTIVGTLIELSGLLLVIAVGLPHFGEVDLLATQHGPSGILAGASLVMFAFIGFSQIATLAEEAEEAGRLLPVAMLASIAITALIYILVAVAAISVVGWEALAASSAPLADVAASAIGGRAFDLVVVIALFSTGNTMLLMLVAGSRLIYGMASREALPRFLAWVHPGRHTPMRAILLALLLAGAFAFTGRLSFVAGATNFAIFVGFGAACVSVVVLRRRRPEAARPFRIPGAIAGVPVVPLLGLAATAALMASLETDVLVLGAVLLASGVAGMEVLGLWREERA